MDQLSTTKLGLPAPRHPDEAEGELSGCRLRLKLDSLVVAWEEELTGTLFIEGGAQACIVSVEIRFAYYPDPESNTIYVPPGNNYIFVPPRKWKAILIQPHERVRVCFKLRVPAWVEFWPVPCQAVVRTGQRHCATLTAGITVAPPRGYQHLALLLAEMVGAQMKAWDRNREGTDKYYAILTLPASSPWPFERLGLELRRSNGTIHGTLVVQPPIEWPNGITTADGWKKTRHYPFQFLERQLNPARPFYEKSLQAYQVALCQLPIPAIGPETAADQLPVPANQGSRAERLKSE